MSEPNHSLLTGAPLTPDPRYDAPTPDETPRTEAHLFGAIAGGDTSILSCVKANFARRLERELTALQARYDADMALMNQRLIEQDANYLRRLQAKTQREGFVPLELVNRLALCFKDALHCIHNSGYRSKDYYDPLLEEIQPYLNPNKEP